jgi:hypothetical protein
MCLLASTPRRPSRQRECSAPDLRGALQSSLCRLRTARRVYACERFVLARCVPPSQDGTRSRPRCGSALACIHASCPFASRATIDTHQRTSDETTSRDGRHQHRQETSAHSGVRGESARRWSLGPRARVRPSRVRLMEFLRRRHVARGVLTAGSRRRAAPRSVLRCRDRAESGRPAEALASRGSSCASPKSARAEAVNAGSASGDPFAGSSLYRSRPATGGDTALRYSVNAGRWSGLRASPITSCPFRASALPSCRGPCPPSSCSSTGCRGCG